MGSYLLKQSKLRADEIVHYAYQFAHEYDREYGSAGFGDSFLPQDEMLRIITDKAMNSIPNCDKDSAFRVAMSTQKILETMGLTVKVAMDAVSEELNKPVNALDPQRDVGAGAGTGEESPQNFNADKLDEPDKAYWHPFGLGMGTEPENARYGSKKAAEKPEDEKFTHEEVDYESPSRHPHQECKDCIHFLAPNACEGVKGPIDADDWCKRFERGKAKKG